MNVILAGSATGGHIYPAIAIADQIKLKNPDSKILFIGAKKELGNSIVTNNGYRIEHINIRGIDRKNLIKNVSVAKDLIQSSSQLQKIFKKFKPDVVIGTGGYVSGPVLKAAKKNGIKTFLHEQNAVPGLANKMAQKYADKIFVAFKEASTHFKDQSKIIVTGNPIRKSFNAESTDFHRNQLGVTDKDFAVLIFGGSNGARKINSVAVYFFKKIESNEEYTVFLITGRSQYWDILEKLNQKGIAANRKHSVIEYTETIHEYYSAADIIVARSGALTVSEITACGKASILIPSPNVTGNHQYYNAKPLEDAGAAIIINEEDLNADMLFEKIKELKNDREKIQNMSAASSELGTLDAVDIIYKELELEQ